MFFRVILYMLLAVILISLLRMVIGVVAKIMSSVFQAPSSPGPVPPSAQNSRLGGDLHRDPVCGTFVAESTPYQRRLGGNTVYFCSEACREKHSLVTN